MIYGDIYRDVLALYSMQKILCIFVDKVTDIFNTSYMVSTRSSTKKVVSKEISDYFTKLVQPLVTTQRLKEMFGKLKEETIERF